MRPETEIIEEVRSRFKQAKDHSLDWRNETKELYDFKAGRQWSDQEQAELEEELRPAIVFNRIEPMVSAVKGHEINNRQEVRYFQRETGDVVVSELLTGAVQWVDDECDCEDEISEIFEDLVICGMGWSETSIGYEEDLDGKIQSGERVSPLEMYWDHQSKRRNLKDARWIARGRWADRKESEQKWPKLLKIEPGNDEALWPDDETDMSPHDASRAHFYENDSREWYNKHRDEVFIVQYQWYDLEPIWRVGDPQSGQLLELSASKYKKLKPLLEMSGIKVVKQQQRKYYQGFFMGPATLEMKVCPWPHGFTLRCVTGKRDALKRHWYGLVRGMIDPQRWSNKFYSDIQNMIVSNRQGGAFVETSALVDPRKAEDDWNQSNPLIIVEDGALGRGAIQERNPIEYPQGLDRMLDWAVNALPAVTGINMEMMGFANRDQANVLEVQRKRSALNVLADLFDSLRRFQKERGRLVLYFIQTYINDGRLIRIIGDSGKQQYVPLALDPNATKFDIIVDEGATSPNQKQETFAILQVLIPFLIQAGIAPPIEMLDFIPLPSSLISKWKEQLNPDEEKPPSPQEQMAMQAQQLEMKKTEGEIALNEAKTQGEQVDAEAQSIENQAVQQGIMSPEDL